jgi:hypothetical protein
VALRYVALGNVNGSVSIVSAQGAAAAIQRDAITLMYNTTHAVQAIATALPDNPDSPTPAGVPGSERAPALTS